MVGRGGCESVKLDEELRIEPLAQNTLNVTGVELLLFLIPCKIFSGLYY